MNCFEARRMAPLYVQDKLSEREVEQFLKHMEHCEDCMEELDIYFMIYRGMPLMEEEGVHDYDFKKRLDAFILDSRKHIKHWKIWIGFRSVLLAISQLLLTISLIVGIQNKYGESRDNAGIQMIRGMKWDRDEKETGSEAPETGQTARKQQLIYHVLPERGLKPGGRQLVMGAGETFPTEREEPAS